MVKRRDLLLAGTALAMSLGIPAIAQTPTIAQSKSTVEVTLVSYAVAKPVFAKIIPEFRKEWKARTGQEVIFKESYGASGAQSRAIIDGLQADILAQNLQSNVTQLVDRNLVSPNWDKRLPNKAIPATSVMVIVTRPGNPKNIKTWKDLTRNNVNVVLINPKTSGNARWGILAGYGPILKAEGSGKANAYLQGLLRNTKTLVNNGREATDTFVRNRVGDALITFENEIIFTNDVIPKDFPYVAPSPNIQVDFPVTVVDSVVDKRGTRKVAEAFTQFLFTPKAQEIYAQLGYRPFNAQVRNKYAREFQSVPKVFTIADFGGWSQINRQLFADGALFDVAQRNSK